MKGGKARVSSPAPGLSTLMTRAPRSARIVAENGTARTWVRSTTRTPSRGAVIGQGSLRFVTVTYRIEPATFPDRDQGQFGDGDSAPGVTSSSSRAGWTGGWSCETAIARATSGAASGRKLYSTSAKLSLAKT